MWVLDLPVRVINIPRQFILGYFDTTHEYFSTAKRKQQDSLLCGRPIAGRYTQKTLKIISKE
jgi:hypothetical protein